MLIVIIAIAGDVSLHPVITLTMTIPLTMKLAMSSVWVDCYVSSVHHLQLFLIVMIAAPAAPAASMILENIVHSPPLHTRDTKHKEEVPPLGTARTEAFLLEEDMSYKPNLNLVKFMFQCCI